MVLSYVIFVPLCMGCTLGFKITDWDAFGLAAIVFLIITGIGVSVFGAYSMITDKGI